MFTAKNESRNDATYKLNFTCEGRGTTFVCSLDSESVSGWWVQVWYFQLRFRRRKIIFLFPWWPSAFDSITTKWKIITRSSTVRSYLISEPWSEGLFHFSWACWRTTGILYKSLAESMGIWGLEARVRMVQRGEKPENILFEEIE